MATNYRFCSLYRTPREEKPVETLFTSRASGFHSSSTESDLSHNFEDKIEEANALIDRVKNALEDIKVVMKSKPVSQEKRGEEHHFLASTKKFSAEAENEKPQSLDGESTSYPLEEQSSLLDQSFDLLMVKLNTIEEASESDVFRSIDQNAEKVVENKILPGSRNCEGFICAAVTNRASSPIEIGEVEGAETLEAQVKSRVEKGKEEVEENKNTNRTCNKCGHSTRPDESIAKLLEKEDKSSTKSDLKEATQLTEVSKRSLGINCNLSIASKEEAVEVNKDDSRTKCQATYCNLSIKSDAEVSNSSKQITNAVEERNRSDAASMKSQGILCNLSVPSVGELVGAAEHGDVPLKISQGVSCNLFAKSDEEMLDAAEDEESETALVKKPITIDNSGKGPKDKNLSIQAMPPINIRQSLVMQQTLHLDIKPTSSVINVMIPNSNIGYREIRKSSNDDVSGPSSGPPSCKDSGNVDASLLEANSKASVPINVVQDDQRSVMTDTSFANRLAKTLKSVSVDRANLSDDRMLFFKSYQVVRQHPKHSVDGMRESSLPNISRVSSEVYKTYINPAGYATTVPSEKSSFVPFYGSVPAKAGVPIGPLGKSSVPATAPTKGDPLCKLSEEIAIAITVPTTDSASYSGSTEDSSSSSNSNKSRSPWDIGFYSSKTTQCDLRKQSSSFSSATVSYRQIVGQFSEIPEKDVPRQDFSSSSGTTGSSDSANTYTKQPEEQPVISADKATSPKVAAPKTKSEGVGSPIEKNPLPSKVDRVIQVSLSSSSDESVVGATEEPHPSTVNYFIETLTQTTVQDISSFQKSSQIAERREELKKISTGFNKNRKSQNAGEPASVREDLSKGEDDNLLNSSVFRTEVAAPSCGSGENNNRSPEGVLFSSQPNNTFFSECNLDVTTSNSTAVDESMSEGEVKCKCSVSIGELHTCKQAKHVKQSVKYLKMHPGRLVRRELKDQSLTIARQKAFYDNWVAYYTERNANRPINDSSSTSTNNSFTK